MRARTEGFNLNTYYKYNIIKDNNFSKKELNKIISKEKPMKETFYNLTNYLQNTLIDSFPTHSNPVDNYKINIECPKISNNSKSFKTLTKDNKPIKFSILSSFVLYSSFKSSIYFKASSLNSSFSHFSLILL